MFCLIFVTVNSIINKWTEVSTPLRYSKYHRLHVIDVMLMKLFNDIENEISYKTYILDSFF